MTGSWLPAWVRDLITRFDRDDAVEARLLHHATLLIAFATALMGAASFAVGARTTTLPGFAAVFAGVVGAQALLRRGRLQAACALFLGGLFVDIAIHMVLSGGTNSPVAATFFPLAIIAAVVVGARAAWIFGLTCVVMLAGVAVVENAGLLPAPTFHFGNILGWGIRAASMFTAAGLAAYAKSLSLESFNRARAADRSLHAVLDNAPIIFFQLDHDGVFTYTDGRGLERMGVKPGRVVGQSVWKAYANEPAILESVRQAYAGQPCTTTSYHAGLDQHWETWWSPIRNATGEFDGVVAVSIEVTERVKAEEGRRRSESSFQSLIERMPDVVLVQIDGKFAYANPAAEQLLGFSQAQFRERSLLDLIHPDDRALTSERIGQVEAQRTTVPALERRVLRADGSFLWLDSTGIPAVFNGKEAVIAVARDTTERRQMQERLRLSDRMVSVGTLAAGVAHEINNPLSYVATNLDFLNQALPKLLADAPASQVAREVQDALTEASEGAERVRRIVRDLKVFARPDEESVGAVDVNEVLESAASMASNEIRHRARLEMDLAPVPWVLGNDARLGQVFINLLINAAQAIPDGNAAAHLIRIVTAHEPEMGRVRIDIHDDGAGIAAEHLSRIFDPFFTTKAVGVGTGLGLSICHGIVRAMGGEITVRSTLGEGTVFTVRLPILQADVQPKAPPTAQGAESRGSILIIDDEPGVLVALKRALSSLHDVECLGDATEALALIRGGRQFDVVLCDMMMPTMGGIAFFEALQKFAPAHCDRVVFLTGGAFTEEAQQFLMRRPHLDKPVTIAQVRAVVAERLRPPADT